MSNVIEKYILFDRQGCFPARVSAIYIAYREMFECLFITFTSLYLYSWDSSNAPLSKHAFIFSCFPISGLFLSALVLGFFPL